MINMYCDENFIPNLNVFYQSPNDYCFWFSENVNELYYSTRSPSRDENDRPILPDHDGHPVAVIDWGECIRTTVNEFFEGLIDMAMINDTTVFNSEELKKIRKIYKDAINAT